MSSAFRRLTMAIPLMGPQTKSSPGPEGLTSAISIQRVSSEDRRTKQREDSCGSLDHCCASCWPIEARYRMHDSVQIKSKKNCILAIPCLLPTGYLTLCFRMASSPHENGFVPGSPDVLDDSSFLGPLRPGGSIRWRTSPSVNSLHARIDRPGRAINLARDLYGSLAGLQHFQELLFFT